MKFKRMVSAIALLFVVSLLVYDSKFHFSEQVVLIKREHNSGQRHWNLFYDQSFVFRDSSMRYQDDLEKIAEIIEPSSVVLADLATSYYVASSSGAYVRNVHQHQGRGKSGRFAKAINSGTFCYLNIDGPFNEFMSLIDIESRRSREAPRLRYVVINSDASNKNVRSDCMFHRRQYIQEAVQPFSKKVFSGEYLTVYEIDYDLATTTAKRNQNGS